MGKFYGEVRHIPNQPLPTGNHPIITAHWTHPVNVIGVRDYVDIQLSLASMPFGSSPACGSDINGDTSIYGCGINYDLGKLVDFESESGDSWTGEGFIKQVTDVDDPHRNCSWIAY
jgi:hypothetical protein